jgi:hypothetical protein
LEAFERAQNKGVHTHLFFVENVPLHRYKNHSLDFLQGGEGELPKLHSLVSLRGCLNSGDELKGIIIARKFFYT